MSKYTESLKIAPKGDKISYVKLHNFLTGDLVGLKLVPVRGQDLSYWLAGAQGCEMIDGPRYYKLTYQPYGIDITCRGGYNAFSMKRHLVNYIKEGVEKGKAEIRKAAEAC